MGEGQVMQARLRKLQRSMSLSAIAIVLFAIGMSFFGRSKDVDFDISQKSSPETSQQTPAEPPAKSGAESTHSNVDAVAKAKIEVLKKQVENQAKPQSASSSPMVGAVGGAGFFDAHKAASDALSRLIETRKCERISGTLGLAQVASAKAACPAQHPLALATASGYSDLLTQMTVNELSFLKQLALYARSESQADPFDLSQVAKVYVQHSDDNVKEQALEIAALLPDRDGKVALNVAMRAIESTVSGPLALQALAILSAHRDHDPAQVDKAVTSHLKNGGWDVRDAIASQLLPFITPSTRAEFVKVLAAEPVRSKVALHIRLNLEEFDRMERL